MRRLTGVASGRQGVFAVLLAAVLATGCGEPAPTRAPASVPASSFQLPPPLASVPRNPIEAARFLAAATLDPTTAAAAVVTILTRSGVPVRSSRTGRVLNDPAQPTFVDAYVYDFEVEFIARAIKEDRTWQVSDLSGFAAAVGVTVNGAPLPEEVFGAALTTWIAAAKASPGTTDSFAALATAALSTARAGPAQAATASPPAISDLDPLQFTLAAASLLSRQGRFHTAGLPPAFGAAEIDPLAGPREVAEGSCEEPKEALEDSAQFTSLGKEAAKQGSEWAVGQGFGEAAGEAFGKFLTGYDLTGDVLSTLLLLVGLDIFVSDDTNEHNRYLQKEAPPRTYRHVAGVTFTSSFSDQQIDCLALAGIELPHNGPLKGWLVQWSLQEDGDHVRPADATEERKIERTGGGAGGEVTGPDGLSTLKVQVRWEMGCPTESTCGTGRDRGGVAIGIAKLRPDPNSLPLKLGDLIGLPAAAAKVLMDLAKTVSMPEAHDKVLISWHEPRFELVFDSTTRLVTFAGSTGGHVKATIPLDDDATGTVVADMYPDISLSGHAPLQYVQVFGHDNACTGKQVPTLESGDLTVTSVKPIWRTSPSFPETPTFSDVELQWSANPKWHCPDGQFFEPEWQQLFDSVFSQHGAGHPYTATGFTGNGLTFTKRYVVKEDGYTENTTITLRPVP